jgi:hypothetical protein
LASGIGIWIGWIEPPHRFGEVLRDGKLWFADCLYILVAANDSDITVPVEKLQRAGVSEGLVNLVQLINQ